MWGDYHSRWWDYYKQVVGDYHSRGWDYHKRVVRLPQQVKKTLPSHRQLGTGITIHTTVRNTIWRPGKPVYVSIKQPVVLVQGSLRTA